MYGLTDDLADAEREVGKLKRENDLLRKAVRELLECVEDEWGPGDPDDVDPDDVDYSPSACGKAFRARRLLESLEQ